MEPLGLLLAAAGVGEAVRLGAQRGMRAPQQARPLCALLLAGSGMVGAGLTVLDADRRLGILKLRAELRAGEWRAEDMTPNSNGAHAALEEAAAQRGEGEPATWHAELLRQSCANESVRDKWYKNALLGCMAGAFCAAYGAGGSGAVLWRTLRPR